MKRITGSGWRLTLAATCLAAAVMGAGMVWADTVPAASAPAVSAANHAAAVEAFKKARDLFQADKLAEAKAENDSALQLDPNFSDAQLLQKIIAGKMTEASGGGTTPDNGTTGGAAEKVRLLKPTDVALIKINEWSADADAQLHGTVARKTLEDFWNEVVKKTDASATREAHDAFLNPANFADEVRKMKDSGDAKFMDKVTFNGDPAALATFRRLVEPYVMQNCATAACHAGDKAGNFKLVRPASGADQSFYTNFYILTMYSDRNGNKMIDRGTPEKSLLLQYGMVKANAASPHPGKVEPHYFTDKSDSKFQGMTDWIKTLAFPRPNYGIVYEVPGAAPAPAPVPAPATRPAPAKAPGK